MSLHFSPSAAKAKLQPKSACNLIFVAACYFVLLLLLLLLLFCSPNDFAEIKFDTLTCVMTVSANHSIGSETAYSLASYSCRVAVGYGAWPAAELLSYTAMRLQAGSHRLTPFEVKDKASKVRLFARTWVM